MNKIYVPILMAVLASCPSEATTTEDEIALIKKQLIELQKRLAKLESDNKRLTKKAENTKAPSVIRGQEKTKGQTKLYASLRPTYGYIEQTNTDFWDIQDALSNAGFKSTYQFKPGWSAIAHGEWSVDLGNNGDFGKARQVYVALNTPFGQLGIGKQRPAQYTLIAEYVDIFNHRSSPFAYDMESPFFVNNMVTYEKKLGHFKFMLGGQFDGENNSESADFINTGLGYSNNGNYASVTYSTKEVFDENQVKLGKTNVYAAMLAKDFSAKLYGAIAYQDVDYAFDSSRAGTTLDISLGYRILPQYRLKLGYFDFDDGVVKPLTKSHNGTNLTLEWLPSDNLRFHLEYLTKSFDTLPNNHSVSIGFRYDYAEKWQY